MKRKGFEYWMPPLVGLAIFALLTFTGNVALDTFYRASYLEIRGFMAKIVTTQALCTLQPHKHFEYYLDEFTVEEFYGTVSRSLVHSQSGRRVSVEFGGQLFRVGVHNPVFRRYQMPSDVEAGEWCLFTEVSYYPGYSLRQHSYVAPPVCAESP